jgi:cystathionine beta-synthase
VVALVCDTGRNYLSKFFDDAWLAANNLSETDQPAGSIGDLLKLRGARELVTITPEATVGEAIDLMQSTGISQLPVVQDGKSLGSVQEVTLARVLHDNTDPNQVAVGKVMARSLPTLDVNVHLDEAYRLLLAGHTGVLAVADGNVVDIVTRIDLVQYWRQRSKVSAKPTNHRKQKKTPARNARSRRAR